MPTIRNSTIALTTAAAHAGAADCEGDEHERDQREPERDAGGRGSAPASSSSASATSPASIGQKAGTSTSVASVIARHFLCGGERAPSGRQASPFTEPAVRPRTK